MDSVLTSLWARDAERVRSDGSRAEEPRGRGSSHGRAARAPYSLRLVRQLSRRNSFSPGNCHAPWLPCGSCRKLMPTAPPELPLNPYAVRQLPQTMPAALPELPLNPYPNPTSSPPNSSGSRQALSDGTEPTRKGGGGPDRPTQARPHTPRGPPSKKEKGVQVTNQLLGGWMAHEKPDWGGRGV